ncbi:MAG: 2'-5' RNA ligase family protein [Blastocatellia bacterium]|nr:2'-5' RNA ligase family protein [Blastocatellia bacterium]
MKSVIALGLLWWFGLGAGTGEAGALRRTRPQPAPVTKNMFVSIEIPAKLQHQLETLQKKLPVEMLSLQERAQFHVTLLYIPNISPEKEAALKTYLRAYFSEKKGVTLSLSGAIAHGSWTRASDPAYHYDVARLQRDEQIRVELIRNPDLQTWRQDLVAYAISQGLLPETYSQPFNPHITIATMKTDTSATYLEALKIPQRTYVGYLVTLQVESTSTSFAVDQQFVLHKRTRHRRK